MFLLYLQCVFRILPISLVLPLVENFQTPCLDLFAAVSALIFREVLETWKPLLLVSPDTGCSLDVLLADSSKGVSSGY